MKPFVRSFVLISILGICTPILGQGNPFLTKEEPVSISEKIPMPGFIKVILAKSAMAQHRLHRQWAALIHDIKNGQSRLSIFVLLLVSLGYGILHGIGPGHGKTIMFAWFLSNRISFTKGS